MIQREAVWTNGLRKKSAYLHRCCIFSSIFCIKIIRSMCKFHSLLLQTRQCTKILINITTNVQVENKTPPTEVQLKED